jgi:hypothetical protein
MLNAPLPARARRMAGLAVVAALALGGAATAWAAQSPPALIAQPVWLEKPTAKDMDELFPKAALEGALGLQARVAMTCRVQADGRLRDCEVGPIDLTADRLMVRQPGSPEPGFANAMLALSKRFRMAELSRDGVKTAGGQVRIPVIWTQAQAD